MDIRVQSDADKERVETLVSLSFSEQHPGRAVWKLRPGAPVAQLCLVASDYRNIVGSLRFWEILVAGRPQLLLGPLAVLPELQGRGFGRALVSDGLRRAEQMRRWSFVLAVWRHAILSAFRLYRSRGRQIYLAGQAGAKQIADPPVKAQTARGKFARPNGTFADY